MLHGDGSRIHHVPEIEKLGRRQFRVYPDARDRRVARVEGPKGDVRFPGSILVDENLGEEHRDDVVTHHLLKIHFISLESML